MSLLSRLKRLVFSPPGDEAHLARFRRRRAILASISRYSPYLQALLFIVGCLWILAIPLAPLSEATYIDENALQPGQVSTYWGWGDVHAADRYLEGLDGLVGRNASSRERADWLEGEFVKLGIPAGTQSYAFSTSFGTASGTNTYAFHSSPRTSGAEAMVLSASWTSLTGTPNFRGIASVLALAGFLKRYSHWAKDLVFVISDGFEEGMQAFLNEYHGVSQSNLVAEPLTMDSGVIWTAISLDYPGHSFSHIGVFFEGLNGRLPNQDLPNSAQLIARWTAHVPLTLHDTLDELRADIPSLPSFLNSRELKAYEYRAWNVLQQGAWMASGRASGVHGVFHQFRIDAITLFAKPAMGPHGFHTIGKLTESLLRTTNNMLERLHASFFFYLFTSPTSFLKIGSYLPAAILVGCACLVGGLRGWVDMGWRVEVPKPKPGRKEKEVGGETEKEKKWLTQERRILESLGIMLGAVLCGGVVLGLAVTPPFARLLSPRTQRLLFLPPVLILTLLPPFLVLLRPARITSSPLAGLLKALMQLYLALLITPLSLLNFPLSLSLALLALPLLLLVRPSGGVLPTLALAVLNPVVLLLWEGGREAVRTAVWEWEVLGVSALGVACGVWMPVVWIGQAVCILQE